MPTPLPDSGRSFAQQNSEVLLAMLIFGEARGESMEAKIAVGHVVMNRWRSRHFGTSLTRVILAPNQFSCFNPRDVNHVKIYHPLLHDCQETWDQCFFAGMSARLSLEPDPTDGATFYHDSTLDGPPKDWGSVEKTIQIGRLTFYRPARTPTQAV